MSARILSMVPTTLRSHLQATKLRRHPSADVKYIGRFALRFRTNTKRKKNAHTEVRTKGSAPNRAKGIGKEVVEPDNAESAASPEAALPRLISRPGSP